jgi:hypothetical protein
MPAGVPLQMFDAQSPLEQAFREQIARIAHDQLGFLLKAIYALGVAGVLNEAAAERLQGAVDRRRSGEKTDAPETSHRPPEQISAAERFLEVAPPAPETPRYLLLQRSYLEGRLHRAGEIVETRDEPHAYMEALNSAAEAKLAAFHERVGKRQ